MTEYNDINTYNYSVKAYTYGWMVYHMENGSEVMDMCYAKDEDAKSAALSLNMNEAKRVADAKERIENFKSRFPKYNTPYYSITGYYGD